MDFVKREDQHLIDEEQYKTYLENLQKSHQLEIDYQHTPISMEQLHQAMQSSLNASTLMHNFQLPLSPRQMSTLMLKTNHLSRGLNFNEIPAHFQRNSLDIDLVQNLTQDLPQNLGRPEDLALSHNLSRNLDLTLARNLSSDLELQSNLAQQLAQNLTEQDLARNLSSDLSQNLHRIDGQGLRGDLTSNLAHDVEISHHMNRQVEQEMLSQERRTELVIDNLRDHNLGHGLPQRLVTQTINEHRHIEAEPLLPMPYIKLEQEEDVYTFYDNMNHSLNVNAVNGHIVPEHQPSPSLHQDPQLYGYNHNAVPPLNSIELYARPQNYVQNFDSNRENPQNLVVNRQFETNTFNEEFKKFEGEAQNGAKQKEQPKENLKPTDQNKMFFEYPVFEEKSEDSNEKLTIVEDASLIKGEYVCYKCNEILPSKRCLKQHSRVCSENGENETDEKLGRFSCSQCSYKCQSPAILKIHERVHTGEKPFKCTFCDYKSGQKNNVAKHILVHMQAKPFSCQYCEYRCAQKNNLVVHERTHTGVKPFACPYCDYRTVQKPNLVKHMYLHTDQKPFSCDQCSYRCVQKTNLTKHKQRHLNEKDGKVEIKNQTKPYRPRQKSVKCSHCVYRCVQKSSLEKHMQFKHPEFHDANLSCDDSLVQNLSVKKSVECVVEDKLLAVQS